MAKELLTYCIAKGSRVFMKAGAKWREYTPPHKALCGRLVKITAIKGGDVRNMMDVGVVRVRGHEIATHPKNMKLVGRG